MNAQPASARERDERQAVYDMAAMIAASPRPLADRRGIVDDLGPHFPTDFVLAHVGEATSTARDMRIRRGALVTRFHR